MYRKEILIELVRNSGLQNEMIAHKLEMAEKDFEDALFGRREFKALEIFRLVEILRIDEPGRIFFAE